MEKGEGRALESVRKPFQGVANIIRFNWPFYLVIIVLIALLTAFSLVGYRCLSLVAGIGALCILGATLISLIVSYYVYDYSNLYSLTWLHTDLKTGDSMLNVTAGFDEFSAQIKQKYRGCLLTTCDFFDKEHHAGASIKRARKAYPPTSDLLYANAQKMPFADGSFNCLFVFFAAHEIRNEEQRLAFFKQLNRILKPGGRVIVAEHLRNPVNFFAYNIGFLHFYSHGNWRRTFADSAFLVEEKSTVTPFVTIYTLKPDGTAS